VGGKNENAVLKKWRNRERKKKNEERKRGCHRVKLTAAEWMEQIKKGKLENEGCANGKTCAGRTKRQENPLVNRGE